MHKKKWLKRIIIIGLLLLISLYFVICNILVDVALVPEKMEQTEAFGELTEQSVEALVHTDDIQQNHGKALEETNAWLEQADTEKTFGNYRRWLPVDWKGFLSEEGKS